MDRRRFIKALAATVALTPGSALAGPLLRPATGEAVLLSGRSRLRPQLTANLAAGLRLGLGGDVRTIELRPGTAGLRAALERSAREARPGRLLALHQPGAADTFGRLAHKLGTRALLLDSGANLPRATEHHPSVTFAGLGQWRSDHALGRWAAEQGSGSAVIVSSLYDSGYDLIAAWRAGFESAGGKVEALLLTDDPFRPEAGVESVLQEVRTRAPGAVHVLHSGAESAVLLRGLLAAGTGIVTASSLTLDASSPVDVHSASAWLDHDPLLVEEFKGELPDEFSAFGFELGKSLASGTGVPQDQPIQLFRTATLNGRPGRRILGGLIDSSAQDPQISALAAAPRTGWVTPWLVL